MEPTVYFARLKDGAAPRTQAMAARKAVELTGFPDKLAKKDMAAIKVHVGEHRNVTHLKPQVAASIVKLVKSSGAQPFLTDTSTLYRGRRDNGIKHVMHAHAHGFSVEATGAPFIPADGLSGSREIEAVINGELNKSVKIAAEVMMADALVVLSHPTGHMATALGAAIKNVGMGLASRAGKMRQHSSAKPTIRREDCQACDRCRVWCPEGAVKEKKGVYYIRMEECIGCGQCLAVCPHAAVKFDWETDSAALQKLTAEHAAGAVRHFRDKAVFVNVLADMTKECDCLNTRQKKAVPDLGVLASTDIVAIDQATLDLTEEHHGADLGSFSFPHLDPSVQVIHAEKLGLGRREYSLVQA